MMIALDNSSTALAHFGGVNTHELHREMEREIDVRIKLDQPLWIPVPLCRRDAASARKGRHTPLVYPAPYHITDWLIHIRIFTRQVQSH